MKETEITVQIFNNYQEIHDILVNQGFENVKTYQLNDCYYSSKSNVKDLSYIDLMNSSFLVRNIVDNEQKVQLCYKKKELDEFGNVIMEEKVTSKIDNLNNALEIFELAGLIPYCKVENTSYVYKRENIEFVVQIIKDLGIFIEFEENEDMINMTPQEKITNMSNIIKSLGLKLGSDFSVKKVYMLLHK